VIDWHGTAQFTARTQRASGGFGNPEGFQRASRQKVDAYVDRVGAVDGAYRFQQLAVGASESPAPQGAAGSVTQLDLF
jgi:hypothetical protein